MHGNNHYNTYRKLIIWINCFLFVSICFGFSVSNAGCDQEFGDNCVMWVAKCRVPALPTGLWTLEDKKADYEHFHSVFRRGGYHQQ